MFPSTYCFPLSPKNDSKQTGEDKDLITKMIEQLKPLDEDDISFISQPDAKTYVLKKNKSIKSKG